MCCSIHFYGTNDFLGQIVAIGLLNSCVSVSTCITCPYTHIRYIAQIPSPEGICNVILRRVGSYTVHVHVYPVRRQPSIWSIDPTYRKCY